MIDNETLNKSFKEMNKRTSAMIKMSADEKWKGLFDLILSTSEDKTSMAYRTVAHCKELRGMLKMLPVCAMWCDEDNESHHSFCLNKRDVLNKTPQYYEGEIK